MKRNQIIFSFVAILILCMIGVYLSVYKPFNVFSEITRNQKGFEQQIVAIDDTSEPELNTASSVTSQTERIETLDDAVKWYLNEKEAHKYLEGQHFVASYRILDTQESSESITIYTHILCEWISLNGESVSGGAGLISITFNTDDNVYEYEKSTSYNAQQIPNASEIPQRVKDSISSATYFTEMRSEVDKDIADFLESSR
ncbi:MAG: hypothetical protein K0S04_3493 [Herbinix sp.]|jgi:hypothetical protein|nr:hypothetical protein [Herbinix sp.]